MRLSILLLLAAPLAAPQRLHSNPSPCRAEPGYHPSPGIELDAGRHEVTATQGPFSPDVVMPGAEEPMMAGMEMPGMADTIVQRFAWPVKGWLRGFRLDVCDAAGHPFPEEVVHHMVLVDLGRRQLWRPIAERVLGIGEETSDASLPMSVGVPVIAGEPMAIHIMWHNMNGRPIRAYYRLTLIYTPSNEMPRPTSVLPVVFEASPAIGALPGYDVPPGRSQRGYDFTIPAGGRVLAIGGHLHDYGEWVGLQDGVTQRMLFRVKAQRRPDGTVTGVGRRLLAIRGRGIRLRADHPYRLVATYNNTSPDTLRDAMAQLAMMFAPAHMRDWPAVDTTNAEYQQDLESLRGAHVLEETAHPEVALGRAALRPE